MNINDYVDLNDYIVNILSGKNTYFGLLNAYERAQAIITRQFTYFCGRPQICFLFKYPIGDVILSKTYNLDDLLALGRLSNSQTMEELFNQAKTLYAEQNYDLQIDYIAAMILKAQCTLSGLFSMIDKTAVFMGSSKNFCYTFVNPFITCTNIEPPYRTYGTGQLNSIINKGNCEIFRDIFFFQNCINQ